MTSDSLLAQYRALIDDIRDNLVAQPDNPVAVALLNRLSPLIRMEVFATRMADPYTSTTDRNKLLLWWYGSLSQQLAADPGCWF